MNIKSFDDLDITDPIMFGLVFSNKHIAKPFIEHLLGIKIDHLETPIPEAVLSYDAEHKSFKIDAFQTPKLGEGEEGEVIKKYDKLVLRNGGNDIQFGFIRDELSQTLVKKAGFETYEAVLPVVVYLNGHYYAFHWLHENYCDKYFKERFGDGEGEFVILEGKDQIKDDDDEIQDIVNGYNDTYDKFVASNLTNDSVYYELCKWIDVEISVLGI